MRPKRPPRQSQAVSQRGLRTERQRSANTAKGAAGQRQSCIGPCEREGFGPEELKSVKSEVISEAPQKKEESKKKEKKREEKKDPTDEPMGPPPRPVRRAVPGRDRTTHPLQTSGGPPPPPPPTTPTAPAAAPIQPLLTQALLTSAVPAVPVPPTTAAHETQVCLACLGAGSVTPMTNDRRMSFLTSLRNCREPASCSLQQSRQSLQQSHTHMEKTWFLPNSVVVEIHV